MRIRSSHAVFALFIALLILPKLVSAASLYVSPQSGSYSSGKTFSARIRVSSSQSINAISGTLKYPTDKLQVTSVSKFGSLLTLWIEDPTYDNTGGTVSFEGVVPNPGFSGDGLVAVVTFKVVGTGSATVSLSGASVLANDGSGTDVLTSTTPASYTLSAAAPVINEDQPPNDTVEEPVVVTPSTSANVTVDTGAQPPKSTSWFSSFGPKLLSFLAIAIPAIALLFLLLIVILRGYNSVKMTNRRYRAGLRNVEELVDKSFLLLKEDVEDSIRLLERTKTRRKLTAEEDAIIERFRQNLREAEKVIHSEVRKIEREL